jgi:hypothetical protein
MIRTYGDGRSAPPRRVDASAGRRLISTRADSADLLFLDPPVVNPLKCRCGRDPSQPLPASAHVKRWRNAEADGWPRSGQRAPRELSVRYLPAEGGPSEPRTVDHPSQIAPIGPIRLWIELDVEPGGVESALPRLQLSWEE